MLIRYVFDFNANSILVYSTSSLFSFLWPLYLYQALICDSSTFTCMTNGVLYFQFSIISSCQSQDVCPLMFWSVPNRLIPRCFSLIAMEALLLSRRYKTAIFRYSNHDMEIIDAWVSELDRFNLPCTPGAAAVRNHGVSLQSRQGLSISSDIFFNRISTWFG